MNHVLYGKKMTSQIVLCGGGGEIVQLFFRTFFLMTGCVRGCSGSIFK